MAKQPHGKRSSKMQVIIDEVDRCKNKRGEVTPKAVVERARDPKNPLHGEFEWNTQKLAQQALEARAAEIIRMCKDFVVYGERTITYPRYVSNPRTVNAGYVTSVSIARNADLKRLTLEAELSRIKAGVHRGMTLAIVFDLVEPFEALLDQVIALEKQFATI